MNAVATTASAPAPHPSLIQACLGFLGSTAALTATMALLAAL